MLYRLRFARSRSASKALVEAGHVRRNGQRVLRPNNAAEAGDVFTFPLGRSVIVIRVNTLPERRGPASESQQCYQVLDPQGVSDLAGDQAVLNAGT